MLEMDRMVPSRVNAAMAAMMRRRVTRVDARWGFSEGADHKGRGGEETPASRRGVCPGRGVGGWRVFWMFFHQPIAEMTPPFFFWRRGICNARNSINWRDLNS